MDSFAERVVGAMNDVSGTHPGHRAAHAKGSLMAGTFTPADCGLTTAPHMGSTPSRVTVRFSNGGSDPGVPDYAREGRGMAVKFYLPDGTRTDVVGLSLPCFFVRTPEDFLEFTLARKDPERLMPDWLGAHPEAMVAIQAALGASLPASYVSCTYNSIHAFRWVDAQGGSRWVRYRFEPEAGESSTSKEDAKAIGRDYLQQDLMRQAGAAFRMYVVIAGEGDDPADPTAPWPDDRERVDVGRLELSGPETGREQGEDILVMDPTRVSDGIELSDDQILRFRPRAYSVSVERRTGR